MSLKYIKDVVELENANYITPWKYECFKKRINDNRYKSYIAFSDSSELIGYMIVINSDRGWFIENLTVAKDHRRKGVATIFINMAINVAKPDNIKILVQDIFLDMHLTLKNRGFKAIGVEKDDDGDDHYLFVN